MTTSLWVVFIIIGGICAFVFAKTVSNDAKNDFRIRDIISNSNDEQGFEPIKKQPLHNPEPENIYEEIAQEQAQEQIKESSFSNEYSTKTHEEPPKQQETKRPNYEQEVFYEKINDDACPYDKDEYEDDYIEEDDYEESKPTKMKTVKKRSLFDYVKTFWHGITFTIGMLICIYSFIGVTTQVQTSNDAIVYSIWLLIGVILIK